MKQLPIGGRCIAPSQGLALGAFALFGCPSGCNSDLSSTPLFQAITLTKWKTVIPLPVLETSGGAGKVEIIGSLEFKGDRPTADKYAFGEAKPEYRVLGAGTILSVSRCEYPPAKPDGKYEISGTIESGPLAGRELVILGFFSSASDRGNNLVVDSGAYARESGTASVAKDWA